MDIVEHSLEIFRKYNIYPVLEGREWLYFDKLIYPEDKSKGNLFDEMFKDVITSVSGNEGNYRINKITVFCKTQEAVDSLIKELGDSFDIIQHELRYQEMVPKGYNKGTGIIDFCRRLDIPIEDTFAFGDSTNDLEMFEAVGTAVCMGNGTDDAKAAADYVTGHMEEEGLPDALKHFGLI